MYKFHMNTRTNVERKKSETKKKPTTIANKLNKTILAIIQIVRVYVCNIHMFLCINGVCTFSTTTTKLYSLLLYYMYLYGYSRIDRI